MYNTNNTAPEKVLVLDMDGTVADLYAVPDWLPKLRAEDASPYAEARPMWDMTDLACVLEEMQVAGYRIVVVSWLSKECSREYAADIRRAKQEWLSKHGVPWDEAHFVRYGTPKNRVIHNLPVGSWLVDDDKKIRQEWEDAFGNTIDPTATTDLPALLREKFLAGKSAE